MNIAIIILIFIFISILVYMHIRYSNHINKMQKELNNTKKNLLCEDISQSLFQMDSIYKYYTDENEANRELTISLKIIGHNAKYQYTIDNRIIDIFVDNTIIEGKLDPNQGDIDRLIGQVEDYCKLPYTIYIVLYGFVSQNIISRIDNLIINKHPQQVVLIYLKDVHRIRQS